MKRILLTGFEAFGEHQVNPSLALLTELGGQQIGRARIHTAALPVDAAQMPQVLRAALEDVLPDAVLLTGLAAGRAQLSLERAALNVLDFAIPDNAGQLFRGEGVVPAGPVAYLSTLPLERIIQHWREEHVPGYISNTAGLYLCNQSMYLARHWLGAGVPCGFLHLPANAQLALLQAPHKAPLPYLPQSEITRGVKAALKAVAQLWGETDTEPLYWRLPL